MKAELQRLLQSHIERPAEPQRVTPSPVAPQRAGPQHAARPPPRSRDANATTADEQTPRLQRFIRLADLPNFVGLKRTQIAELIKAGEFPEPIPISDSGRAVAWLESEVLAWQVKRIAKR